MTAVRLAFAVSCAVWVVAAALLLLDAEGCASTPAPALPYPTRVCIAGFPQIFLIAQSFHQGCSWQSKVLIHRLQLVGPLGHFWLLKCCWDTHSGAWSMLCPWAHHLQQCRCIVDTPLAWQGAKYIQIGDHGLGRTGRKAQRSHGEKAFCL